jgi:cellulose 1,4-beta-cellobiosidase
MRVSLRKPLVLAATATLATSLVIVATSSANAAAKLDNPYAGAKAYVNPDWSAQAAASGGQAIANQPTAIWLDRIAAIESGSAGSNTMGLRDHLDAAVDQGANLIQVVIYNLPGRDCAALASNGELGPTELSTYQNDYIDPIVDIMGDAAYANLRIVTVVEIDSLPNLVTNVSPRPTATPECDVMKANGNYVQGVGYALAQLGALPNVYNYIDIGHHGWLGWTDNFGAAADVFLQAARANGAEPSDVHGFAANVANYGILDEPFFEATTVVGGKPVRETTTWVDWNNYVAEVEYAQAYRTALIAKGFDAGLGMIIDTSRNGWGGPDRPTAASTSTNPNTFVNDSRLDRRIHLGNWCNQSGAGLGERPKASPATGIDAYAWIKPPGESDGSSTEIPNEEGKGFDRMCDPTYTGNPRNNNNLSGALPGAPLSGHWFQAQFAELLANAYPPL